MLIQTVANFMFVSQAAAAARVEALAAAAARERSVPSINTIWLQPCNDRDSIVYGMLFIRRDTRPAGTGIAAGGGESLLLKPWENTFLMQDLFYITSHMLDSTDKACFLNWCPDLFDVHARFTEDLWKWFITVVHPKIRSHYFTNEWCTYALIGVIKSYLPHYMWTGNLLLRGFDANPDSFLHESCPGAVTRSRSKLTCPGNGLTYRLVKNSSKILFDRIIKVLQFDDSGIFSMYDNYTYGEPEMY